MIRKATVDDLNSIWQLFQSAVLDTIKIKEINYLVKTQKYGFIVSDSNKEEIKSRITNSTIFNVCEENNKIIGFIDFNKEIYFPERAENIVWFDQSLKKEYFHGDKNIALHLVITNGEARNHGIASKLLIGALKNLKKQGIKYIFSIITTGPLTNCPSIIWHTKMGFSRACVTHPIDIFGLKNYTGLLYFKKI